MIEFLNQLPVWQRVALLLAVAIGVHVLARVIRASGKRAMTSSVADHISKSRTIISLVMSVVIFALYFGVGGLILTKLGVSLTTYFASASIIGLAVAFGSQGLVQDVVSGLTVVFTDLFDIGDVVEIGGQVGVVEKFGMRFTVLRNPMGAEVFVPNRSITNVIAYPRGYVRCLVDVILPEPADQQAAIRNTVEKLTDAATEQFPGILRAPPEITGPHETGAGTMFLRVKFRIWPGRGAPIEGFVRQSLLQAIRRIAPDQPDWTVSVNYEVESYLPPNRRRPSAFAWRRAREG
ncbi:MAG: mechanosensitive ion channel [Alphaproteobacteria bacterium]|nr:mechanosensitive ion channel [Alphaproteobacteria bacterium]